MDTNSNYMDRKTTHVCAKKLVKLDLLKMALTYTKTIKLKGIRDNFFTHSRQLFHSRQLSHFFKNFGLA